MVRKSKKARAERGKGQSSRQPLSYPPAAPLTPDQEIRRNILEFHRTLEPSRWICRATLEQLGLTAEVQMLTKRLGLWEFLCDEVQTYRGITIEFLSSYSFDRASRVMQFNLGGYRHEMHTTELMAGFGLPTENVEHMRTILNFFHDLNEHHFRLYTCHDGELGPQRVKNIFHPTLRYLQRVLSHTLFARGETASVFNLGDMVYVCSMLRRNNGEMNYMPHLGYNLAKHIKLVATNKQSGGMVRIGGIITKIARLLNIPTGDDEVEGPTLVDLDALKRARLIKWDDIQEAWINLGPARIRHRLPLQTGIDPLNYDMWKIVDEPLEPQQPPPPELPAESQQAPGAAQPQGGPSMQQMWDFMQTINTSIGDLRIHIDGRMDAFECRMDAFECRMDEVEVEAASANFYARKGYMHNNPNYDDDSPTPPYQRRAAIRREGELARQREAAAAAAQAEQEATAAQQGNDDDEEDEEDAENRDNMDQDDE